MTFRLGAEPKRLTRRRASIGDRRGHGHRAAVVSTIPIDHVRVCGLQLTALPTVTLISLFFSFSGDRGFASSILYNFAHSGAWKRLTVYSDFYGRSMAGSTSASR